LNGGKDQPAGATLMMNKPGDTSVFCVTTAFGAASCVLIGLIRLRRLARSGRS
jgi:hypothetical protein